MNDKVIICNIKIDNISFNETIDKIIEYVNKKSRGFVVTPNVDHVIKLQTDPYFRKIYEEAALVVADGMPLIWASRIIGTPLKERVNGTDLLVRLSEVADRNGYRIFFLGGRPGAAVKASEKLKSRGLNWGIAGIYSPPYGFEEDRNEKDKIIRMINDSKADILFVGLGAPRQEKWIFENYRKLNVYVSLGIGVSFELVSGLVKRAPVWMQKAGLEWFWRLIMEPRRLWRRYLIDDTKFLWLLLKQILALRHINGRFPFRRRG